MVLTGHSGDELERPEHPDGPQRAQVDAVVLLAAGLVAGRPRRVLRRQDGDVPAGGEDRRRCYLLRCLLTHLHRMGQDGTKATRYVTTSPPTAAAVVRCLYGISN